METKRIFDLEKFRKEGKCTTVEGKLVEFYRNVEGGLYCKVHDIWDNGYVNDSIYSMNGEYLCEKSELDRWSIGHFDPKLKHYNLTTDPVVSKLSIGDLSMRINPKIRSNENVSIFNLYDILGADYILDFDVVLSSGVNLQRGLVWATEQKQELIKSVLKGIYIPPVTCVKVADLNSLDYTKTTYQIIDGKQRITTMMSFAKNEFPINHNGVDYFFDDLTYAAKRKILGYYFTGSMYFSYKGSDSFLTDEDYIAIFEYVNFTGTPQDKDHIDKLKQN